MKKQFAIIGVDKFGKRMIEELSHLDCEIMIIDKDPQVVEMLKDQVDDAFIADVFSQETLGKIIPQDIDAVIVDLGDRQEVSILVTNYLHKAGIKRIIVRAGTDEHGEILRIVGATDVIFPSQEAARRITPLIAAPLMVNYLPLSPDFVLAEIKASKKMVGTTIFDADLKEDGIMNVIAVRQTDSMDYSFTASSYIIQEGDFLLVAGSQEEIVAFSDDTIELGEKKKKSRQGFFGFLGWKQK